MSPRRIDTHHHFVPLFYQDWLERNGVDADGLPIPDWSPQASLELMDAHGIETAILSISTPNLARTGTLDRCPDIKLILSHGRRTRRAGPASTRPPAHAARKRSLDDREPGRRRHERPNTCAALSCRNACLVLASRGSWSSPARQSVAGQNGWLDPNRTLRRPCPFMYSTSSLGYRAHV